MKRAMSVAILAERLPGVEHGREVLRSLEQSRRLGSNSGSAPRIDSSIGGARERAVARDRRQSIGEDNGRHAVQDTRI